MNGPTPVVLPNTIKGPNSTSTATMGIIHHILAYHRKASRSAAILKRLLREVEVLLQFVNQHRRRKWAEGFPKIYFVIHHVFGVSERVKSGLIFPVTCCSTFFNRPAVPPAPSSGLEPSPLDGYKLCVLGNDPMSLLWTLGYVDTLIKGLRLGPVGHPRSALRRPRGSQRSGELRSWNPPERPK